MRLAKLQESDEGARKIRATKKLQEGWKDIDEVLHHQRLLFVLEAICTELISCYHNDLLAGHFEINKTRKLIGQKYYWPSLRKDVAYVKGCDVCLGSKTVRHKAYDDLQALAIQTYQWKDFSIDFVTRLPISTN